MKETIILIQVNPSSSNPIYAQIIEKVKYSIANGSLKVGDQLPSVRELASQLKVNPNTVAKAYRELEYEGIIQVRHGSGAYVSEKGHSMKKQERLRIVTEKLDQAIVEAIHLGIEEKELEELFTNRLKSFKNKRR